MKKWIVLTTLLLSACTPHVTVTSEVTVTSTPTSTATETPAPPTQTATLTVETRILNGVTFTLGEVNDDGSVKVTGMRVDGNYTDEQKAEKLIAVDPLAWGFESGEVELVFVGDKLQIVTTGDYSQVLAEWNYGKNAYVWNGDVMKNFEGGNPIFDLAKVIKTNGGSPVDMKAAHHDSDEILNFAHEEAIKISGKKKIQPINIYDGSDRSNAIVAWLIDDRLIYDSANPRGEVAVDGIICFIDGSGELRQMRVRNFNVVWRGWN